MVFEYAEHDFLVCTSFVFIVLPAEQNPQQIIHHHSQTIRSAIPQVVLKSLIYQLINGLLYLHSCHILHRDLKPANILITSKGVVKIGDLGLARLCYEPLQPLFAGDKVVVTIWYRAPELLMGAKHYNKAVDSWAVGCVMAELASLRPIFKGEEAKLDSKKNVPFQRDQLLRIFEVMGTPDSKSSRLLIFKYIPKILLEKDWPGVVDMPEYHNMMKLDPYVYICVHVVYPSVITKHVRYTNHLQEWCHIRIRSHQGYDLLCRLFAYDPNIRLTAKEALQHKWFHEDPKPTWKYVPPHVHLSVLNHPNRAGQCFRNCRSSSIPATSSYHTRRSTFHDASPHTKHISSQ